MQTFLPLSSFQESAKHLDKQRLWKQVVEAHQILNCLAGKGDGGWTSHPAVKMWYGYENALKLYYNTFFDVVKNDLGYNIKKLRRKRISGEVVMPHWLGRDDFHSSHRAALLFKNPEFYSKFGWSETPKLEYVWPAMRIK